MGSRRTSLRHGGGNAMSMQRRVVITGLGVVSPLGCDLLTICHLLSSGARGIRPITHFDASPFRSSLAGEVRVFDASDFIPAKRLRRMGRVAHFAVASALMAVRDTNLDLERENHEETAVAFGTSLAGLKEALE